MSSQNKDNKTIRTENLVVSGILATTVLSGMFLTLPSALADDVVDTITITVPSSCSMSSTIATGDEHTAEINNGQYNSAIGETIIKAFCNDNEGFAIYAIGYTDNELGKNVLTNSTLGSTHDIVTGTAITGNTSNWAMKLSTITSPTPTYPIIIAGSTADTLKQQNDPDFSNFTEVPDEYEKVAYRTSATDINPEGSNTAEGSTIKTTYQAYISPTQAAGEYTGQVKYTMIHPHNEAAPVIPVTIADATTMQEVNSCPADLPEEVVYTIKDSRDNQDYRVAKLKDGKCWMVENLNLAGGTALDADKTDVTSAYISSFTTSNNLTKNGNTIVLPTSSTSGFDTVNISYVYNSGNKTNCGAEGQSTPCYSYYSWDAATLGSGRTLNTENTDAPYSICPKGWRLPTSGNLSNNEWKRGDFYKLATAYGANLESIHYEDSSTFYNNAGPNTTVPKFLLAGYYYYGSFYYGGIDGLYWSSTSASTTSTARYLSLHSSDVCSAYDSDRYSGFSVRCLLSGQ